MLDERPGWIVGAPRCDSIATRRRGRRALSLLELLVVLTILIALAGIVVSSLPGLLSRTQTATAAANVSEIDNALRGYQLTQSGQIGNRFDSVITGSSGRSGVVPGYVGGATNFVAVPLGADGVDALKSIGVTELIPAADVASNATFDSHVSAPVPLTAESKVCALSTEFAQTVLPRIWNLQPREKVQYLVFGLGQQCTLVGAGVNAIFKEAPIHFSDNAAANPKLMYSRYLIVVELDRTSELGSKARYVGVGIPHPTGMIGMTDELKQHYSSSTPQPTTQTTPPRAPNYP